MLKFSQSFLTYWLHHMYVVIHHIEPDSGDGEDL
jgi:hypothetical protein